jgi:hypothetical protein
MCSPLYVAFASPNHTTGTIMAEYIVQTRQGDKFALVDAGWAILTTHRDAATKMTRDEAERIAGKRSVSLVAVPA